MSSRALRRLERLEQSKSPELVESDDEPIAQPVKTVNAFALLGGDSDESDEEPPKEKPVEKPREPLPKAEQPPKQAQPSETKQPKTIGSALTQKTKSKQRSKRKGRKGKLESDDEDIDKFLEEQAKLNRKEPETVYESDFELEFDETPTPVEYADSNFLHFTTARLKASMSLLSVGSIDNLNPDTELSKLFGTLSFETVQEASTNTFFSDDPESLAQLKKMARMVRGWSGKDGKSVPGTTRKLLLTTIKDDWFPTTERPMSVEDLSTDKVVALKEYKDAETLHEFLQKKTAAEEALGVRYFSFRKQFTGQEQVANARFYAAVVLTADHEALGQILRMQPYHVETLLQISMVVMRQGNKAMSNAFRERALFLFDRSFGKRLHELLSEGKTQCIRLPYERFMNRQFYLCLFRTITGFAESSTFLTALNYCKFLLALSPAEDPLGVRYFIDHYAISSEQYAYLIKLVNSPLVETYSVWYTPGLAFSEVLAHLHLGKTEEAKASLQRAFKAHTYCAAQLLSMVAAPPKAEIDRDDAAVLAAETYLIRAHVLWKEPAHQRFLAAELRALFETVPKKLWFGGLFKGKKTVDIPHNLIRFAVLSGESKVLAKIPQLLFSRSDMLEYDVMPPKDETAQYDVYSGVQHTNRATDALMDYVDQNALVALVEQNSREADVGFLE